MPRASNPWQPDELAMILRDYADTPTTELARKLGRSPRAVYECAYALGLRKSAQYMATHKPGRLDGIRGGATRFKPGQTPPNKGLRRPGWGPGRMKETQFKKGRPASEARNYRPIGSLRLSKDGYLERKVTDDPSIVPAQRWVGVHRLVWESANGAIPPGHIVCFRAGMRTTEPDKITADRLELISRVENMRRNTLHNLPKPVADVVRLRGCINRQINKRKTP